MDNLWPFLVSFWDYWTIWISISAAGGLANVWEKIRNKPVHWRWSVSILTVGVCVSVFQAWEAEYVGKKALAGSNKQLEAENKKIKQDYDKVVEALILKDRPIKVVQRGNPVKQRVLTLARQMTKFYELLEIDARRGGDFESEFKDTMRSVLDEVEKEGVPTRSEYNFCIKARDFEHISGCISRLHVIAQTLQ